MKPAPLFKPSGRLFGACLYAMTFAAPVFADGPENDPLIGVTVPAVRTKAVADPKIMFERSSVVGIDNAVNAYNVPVSDPSGIVSCYDLVISLAPTSTGLPPTKATVSSVACPVAQSGGIVAGTYTDAPYTGSCVVSNFVLQDGRTESLFKCVSDSGYDLQITVVSGTVDPMHPYYAQLSAAGIDQRPDVNNYIWGVTTALEAYPSDRLGNCSGFVVNQPVGAQQAGNSIMLSTFSKAGVFYCAPVIKQ